jgi:hypothetical protein
MRVVECFTFNIAASKPMKIRLRELDTNGGNGSIFSDDA